MRVTLIVIGIIVLAIGIWIIAGDASYPSTDTIVKIGDAELNATTDEHIPPWIGISGIVVGGLLLLGGILRKR